MNELAYLPTRPYAKSDTDLAGRTHTRKSVTLTTICGKFQKFNCFCTWHNSVTAIFLALD